MQELFDDGHRFTPRNLVNHSMHIYHSALISPPCNTALFRMYISPHTDRVNAIAFSGGGSRLAPASYDETVRLWDTKTGAQLAIIEGHFNQVHSVAFSADGSRFASAPGDNAVGLWEPKRALTLPPSRDIPASFTVQYSQWMVQDSRQHPVTTQYICVMAKQELT